MSEPNNKLVWSAFAGAAPWATIFAVLFTVLVGIVHVVDVNKVSFDEYTTQIVGLWSFLALGRGLAAKDDAIDTHPLLKFLNTFPWSTVVVGVVGVVGYVDVISGGTDSLSFTELGTKMAVLIGALGIGRGIATFKKDTTFRQPALETHIFNSGPTDIGVSITDENVGKLSAQAGVADVGVAQGEPPHEDADLGAAEEPGPIKAPPQRFEGGDTEGI